MQVACVVKATPVCKLGRGILTGSRFSDDQGTPPMRGEIAWAGALFPLVPAEQPATLEKPQV
jgi:hypothetical protein